MKITSLVTSGVLEFNDLGSYIKGVSPILRSVRLNPGESKYLVETGEVLLSAQAGDIYRFSAAGKISVNDDVVIGATLVAAHNFGFVPQVTVINKTSGVQLFAGFTVTTSADLNTTTIVNSTGVEILVRIN